MVMNAGLRKSREEKLIEQFSVQPGDLYRTIENAKWLIHATDELAGLLARKTNPALN